VINFPYTPLYNDEDFAISADKATGYEYYQKCSSYSYNYTINLANEEFKSQYGIYCPLLSGPYPSKSTLIQVSKFTFPSVSGEHVNDVFFSLSTQSG
jgi:hypothetical protein